MTDHDAFFPITLTCARVGGGYQETRHNPTCDMEIGQEVGGADTLPTLIDVSHVRVRARFDRCRPARGERMAQI